MLLMIMTMHIYLGRYPFKHFACIGSFSVCETLARKYHGSLHKHTCKHAYHFPDEANGTGGDHNLPKDPTDYMCVWRCPSSKIIIPYPYIFCTCCRGNLYLEIFFC